NDVRKAEHRSLLAEGDETLLRSKYLWLYSEENLPEKHHERFAYLKASNLKTARAWAIKESLRELWNFRRPSAGEAYWKRWFHWATHSRLAPIAKAAWTIK